MTRLTKFDWLNAGYLALVENGVAGIRAEALAKNLCLNKGSFYGYFANLRDYQSELLEQWCDVATHEIIKRFDAHEEFDIEGFVQLITNSDPDYSFETRKAELAIREWGRSDEVAYEKIVSIDQIRLNFLEKFFDAPWKAQCFYQAWIGGESLFAENADEVLLKLWELLQGNKD